MWKTVIEPDMNHRAIEGPQPERDIVKGKGQVKLNRSADFYAGEWCWLDSKGGGGNGTQIPRRALTRNVNAFGEKSRHGYGGVVLLDGEESRFGKKRCPWRPRVRERQGSPDKALESKEVAAVKNLGGGRNVTLPCRSSPGGRSSRGNAGGNTAYSVNLPWA